MLTVLFAGGAVLLTAWLLAEKMPTGTGWATLAAIITIAVSPIIGLAFAAMFSLADTAQEISPSDYIASGVASAFGVAVFLCPVAIAIWRSNRRRAAAKAATAAA